MVEKLISRKHFVSKEKKMEVLSINKETDNIKELLLLLDMKDRKPHVSTEISVARKM